MRKRLKLFGFSLDAKQALWHHVRPEDCDVEQVRPVVGSILPNEIWVVSVTAAEEFQQAVRVIEQAGGRLPLAVLWIPQGYSPLMVDQWRTSNTFKAQLEEASEDDHAFLHRISRCGRVMTWGDWVADIPAAWFARLTGSPYRLRIDTLPLQADDRQHLHSCPACLEEVYIRLQQRATFRWALLCPAVEELTAWLEAEDEAPEIETHVTRCGLCRETVDWQARLWEQEGILPAAHLYTKLMAVGLVAPKTTP